jgi:uncharacterized Zn-finger protein
LVIDNVNKQDEEEIKEEPIDHLSKKDGNFFVRRRNKCKICKHSFNSIDTLKAHYETVHQKQKNYKCNICKFVTYFKPTLINHMKDHAKKPKTNEQVKWSI